MNDSQETFPWIWVDGNYWSGIFKKKRKRKKKKGATAMVRQLSEIGPLKTYQALSPPLLTVPSTNDDSNDKEVWDDL